MSALPSHNISQPLPAPTRADSAAILIERGQAARVWDNLGQIFGLIIQIPAIPKHRCPDARKPDPWLQDIDLCDAVVEASAVVKDRFDAAGLCSICCRRSGWVRCGCNRC